MLAPSIIACACALSPASTAAAAAFNASQISVCPEIHWKSYHHVGRKTTSNIHCFKSMKANKHTSSNVKLTIIYFWLKTILCKAGAQVHIRFKYEFLITIINHN